MRRGRITVKPDVIPASVNFLITSGLATTRPERGIGSLGEWPFDDWLIESSPMTNSVYNLDEPEPSEEEIAGAKQDAKEYLRLWKTRAFYASAAFFLGCASVTPFLYGHPLHAYWESFGKYLVLLSMALLIPFVLCVGIAINSWFLLRSMRKGKL